MTVTNSHAELPERDWTEHFPESPPDFRDGPEVGRWPKEFER